MPRCPLAHRTWQQVISKGEGGGGGGRQPKHTQVDTERGVPWSSSGRVAQGARLHVVNGCGKTSTRRAVGRTVSPAGRSALDSSPADRSPAGRSAPGSSPAGRSPPDSSPLGGGGVTTGQFTTGQFSGQLTTGQVTTGQYTSGDVTTEPVTNW